MANIRAFTDKNFQNEGMEVDFDLQKVFNVPPIEVSNLLSLNFPCLVIYFHAYKLRQMPQTSHAV